MHAGLQTAIDSGQLQLPSNQPPNGIAQSGMNRCQDLLVTKTKLNEYHQSKYDV
jgi:hypothetical protein